MNELPQEPRPSLAQVMAATRRAMGEAAWLAWLAEIPPEADPEAAAASLAAEPPAGAPPHLADLARIELARWRVEAAAPPQAGDRHELQVNPTLELLPVGYSGLPDLLAPQAGAEARPSPQPAHVACWRPSPADGVRARQLEPAELLALKLVVEGISPREAARQTDAPLGVFANALQRGVEEGLILAPASALRRDPAAFPDLGQGDRFLAAPVFTLQWHLTQACDLHCRHCYDRSARSQVELDQGLDLLDQLFDFCQERHVLGHVSLSGGNPLLHPQFLDIYRAALERGFTVGILGNPSPRGALEDILAIGEPAFFQVSLEGLAAHNDFIRGTGHFERTLEFLDLLGELGVYRLVMLTLTRDNLGQVIDLGRALAGRTEEMNFNRLALVGEGASLALPRPGDYQAFLEEYLAAADGLPVLGLKDSLFNPILAEKGREPMGGCTGFGCGAAFNFLAVLPDGEVHACRKFPSLVGNLQEQGLAAIYDSDPARAHRARSLACAACDLSSVCGGCRAVTASLGFDPNRERDPFCPLPPAA